MDVVAAPSFVEAWLPWGYDTGGARRVWEQSSVRSDLTMAASAGVITLLKASSRDLPLSGISGDTLNLGRSIRRWRHSLGLFSLLGHRFGTSSCWNGLVVVWCCFYRVGIDGPWRFVAAEYRRQIRDDGCTYEGGDVRHHGDIDNKTGKVIVLIFPEDGLVEDGDNGF